MVVSDQTRGQQLTEHLLPFEALYERYHLRVYRYFRAHISNEDDVADLVQQVFFQLWMQLRTYQPQRGSFATWLFSIAHHRLVDFYRAARVLDSWETLYEMTLQEQSPEDLVISAELLAWVNTLLDSLPQAERELLALRFAAHLSIAEIAAMSGKSVEATKKQLSRLLRRLQKLYHAHNREEPSSVRLVCNVPAFVILLCQAYALSPPVARRTIRRIPFPFFIENSSERK